MWHVMWQVLTNQSSLPKCLYEIASWSQPSLDVKFEYSKLETFDIKSSNDYVR